jgi:hypothetical protein
LDVNKAGVSDQALIKQMLQSLEKQNCKSLIYYKVFYWTFVNYIKAFEVTGEGFIEVDEKYSNGFKEKGLEYFVTKSAEFVADAASNLPVIGGLFEYLGSAVDYYFETLYERKFENKKNAIIREVQSKCNSETEKSLQIQKLILKIINYKKNLINNP